MKLPPKQTSTPGLIRVEPPKLLRQSMLISTQAEVEERGSLKDDSMDGCNGEQMCRRIPFTKAALQEHVQTVSSEAQGTTAFIAPAYRNTVWNTSRRPDNPSHH